MRQINLRQIEAFKAIIESGTVSAAADVMGISQPAASKLLAHLEDDVGLELFDRHRGRLVPNARGMHLYEEVQRIFAGVRQVERAAESIRREEQGRITVGIMPGLSGHFIQQAARSFLGRQPHIFVSVKDSASRYIAEWAGTRQVDLGIISARFVNPSMSLVALFEHPMTCILPSGHPLAGREEIVPGDLDGQPFVSVAPESQTRQLVDEALDGYGIGFNTVLEASTAPTVCECVAAGLGLSIAHPLLAHGVEGRVVVRPFKPDISYGIVLARSRDARNVKVVDAFIAEAQATAETIVSRLLNRDRP